MAKGKTKGKTKPKPKMFKDVKHMITKVLNAKADHKWVGVGFNVVALVAGIPQIVDLTTMLQGTTENTRVGLQIQPTSMKIRVATQPTAAGNALVRLIYFRWHPDNAGAFPTYGQLMGPGSAGAVQDIYSSYNVNNKSQFTILHDHTFRCSVGSGLLSPIHIKSFSPGKAKVTYNTGGGVGSGENHIMCALISDVASIVVGTNLINFTDI